MEFKVQHDLVDELDREQLTGLEVCGGGRAGPGEEPLQAHLDHPQTSLLTGRGQTGRRRGLSPVQRDRLGAALHDVDVKVVLEVLTDPGEGLERIYAVLCQVLLVPFINIQSFSL